jgi:hypothetical protein
MKAKEIFAKKKVYFGLLSQKHALKSLISMSKKALEDVIK